MHSLRTKQALLILVIGLLVAIVGFLYPYGTELLHQLRYRPNNATYGKEVIYSVIDNGDIKIAEKILQNKFEISRFQPVQIDQPNWREDPYKDIYWRFNYYNLEPARNLLYAWEKTGRPEFKNKMIELTRSFIDRGADGPFSWDYHGVAFRTMTLVNIRQKLSQKGELPADFDEKLQASLARHGRFLADPAHFESGYNHGLDQAAALLVLAVNFPAMKGSDGWFALASRRIAFMQSNIIDNDGILVENSPFYHFYVLEKFLEIRRYLRANGIRIENLSDEKIDKMISYAAYILQPDLSVPAIGASISRKINLHGHYKDVAQEHRELLYVLTQGARGRQPSRLSVNFPAAGQTIMRSGWEKGQDFERQTQLVFDVGEYRTNHSDLDALSFNLFARGLPLLPDAGLYSYGENPMRQYFHGTRAHNTVVVDGKDQSAGVDSTIKTKNVYAGPLLQGDGYSYQSAVSYLYDGVTHRRAISLIGDSTLVVLDSLESETEHTYEQMFHLFPGALIEANGLTLTARSSDPAQQLTITQLSPANTVLKTTIDQANPPDGYCSTQYLKADPCYAVSYAQTSKTANFVTVISIGQDAPQLFLNGNTLDIASGQSRYEMRMATSEGTEKSLEVIKNMPNTQDAAESVIPVPFAALKDWTKRPRPDDPPNDGTVTPHPGDASVEISTPSNGSRIDARLPVKVDLSDQNIYFEFKVDNIAKLNGLDLHVSNSKWKTFAKFSLKSFLPIRDNSQDGKWIRFGVAKGELRNPDLGNWQFSGPGFDWSAVDGLAVVATSAVGSKVSISLRHFQLSPDQANAYAVLVFDDGWDTVLDAAEIMKKYGLKGNIGVITGSVGGKRYLSLEELKTLQDEQGWDIVSHSALHKDAIQDYVRADNLRGLDEDLRSALTYLEQNNINSAPNWYIYPDGRTNSDVEGVVRKYYKFARATIEAPGAFPFANPLEATTFAVYSNAATPLDIHNAVSDAIKYRQTLFLMFHKFSRGTPKLHTEYALDGFEEIIRDLKEQGIQVVTLSELDRINGIPPTEFVIHEQVPSQFELQLSVEHGSSKLRDYLAWHTDWTAPQRVRDLLRQWQGRTVADQ